MFVAMLTLADCQSSAPTLGNQGTMSPLAANRVQQPWNNGAASGGMANQSQAGANGMNNGQVANSGAMTRSQSGQSFGANGNLQNNSANNAQQSPGFGQNQNSFANNQQQTGGFNAGAASNTVQPVSYNPNVGSGAGQQAGGWSNSGQNSGFSAVNRNMARNAEAGQNGFGSSGASSMPAPSFPNNSAFDGASSKDPPQVAKPTEYNTKYPGDLPFAGGKVSNQ
jgi:hypothetical protein